MNEIIQLRRELHGNPELSANECRTAQRIIDFLTPLNPDVIHDGLGGTGVAFEFAGGETGPTVLLRCELDALPIQETNQIAYRSKVDGVSHKCGHDGHMAIVAGIGKELALNRPNRGRVVLLFQPAEETGQGASAVIRDPRFQDIKPDFAFALHNLPGFPLGDIIVRNGPFSSASRGMVARLLGTTAHAAQPETGLNPVEAMCRVIHQLLNIPSHVIPVEEMAFVTVVGSRLGEKAFGTAAGSAEVWATLRSEDDETMASLVRYAGDTVEEAATAELLQHTIAYEDIFCSTVNSSQAVDIVRRSAGNARVHEIERPFRWSEDFGRFSGISQCALFGLGAGQNVSDLHNPDYDFPDELIDPALAIFRQIIAQCLA